MLVTLVACQRKGLSAKELFELRSQCKALVDKWEKDSEADGYHYVVQSHYDVKANRCLLRAHTAGGTVVILQDAQSNTVLAECDAVNGEVHCELNGSRDLPRKHVMHYIETMMGDDR